ncbi:cytochrome b/b6 domain-containing protein [Parendozoicomonas haliclonae]|nr:cytochrome b/b6 domain-containing protein [Parendozoicomonas haliclonae]
MDKLRSIRVWDIPTRLFHWLLVLSVAGLWYTGEEGDMDRHVILGFVVLSLLIFRLFWGFWGGDLSRFKAFQLSPKTTIRFLKNGMKTDYPGHNPLGSWGVVFILLCLTVQVVTGLFSNDSILFDGPLVRFVSGDFSSLMTTIHSINFDILLGILAVHIAGVLFHIIFHKEDILQGMIHGRRKISSRYEEPDRGSWEVLAVAILVAVMVITWMLDLI